MSPKEILQSIINSPDSKTGPIDIDKFINFFLAKNRKLKLPPNSSISDEEIDNNFTKGRILVEGKLDDGELIVCSFLVKKELTERSGKKAQYNLGKKILKYYQADAGIFIFYDSQGNFRFSLIYTNYLGKRRDWSNFKRFTYFVSPELTNKTFLKQIGEGDFSTLENIKEAFSVEKVTKEFFDGFIELFNKIKKYLIKQKLCDIKTTHNFVQQLLNRILFLYFVQKKEWLGRNKHFLRYFWRTYKENSKNKNEFYEKWLKVLFLETFNNKFFPKKYLPKELNDILMLAPYLNGGLFKTNKLDDILFKIEDIWFEQIFEFFERYNFTIDENSENDVDLEVDPKFIGDIYESLVNCSETEDEQGEKGIFYTDRVEIDFMARRSLVEYFYNNLPKNIISKDLIYKFIFSKTDDEITEVEKELNKLQIWDKIEEALDNLTVLDPACGSGSFLVGMLTILTSLYRITYKNLNRPIDDFEIKKQIIGRSLYGVDVMEWACHVAELRLWLQLIVDADLKPEELKCKPLLPNLTFKIRPGDSLVQEIGGINLSLKDNREISPNLKRKLTEIKQEKLKFFNNDPSGKFRSEDLLLNEELRIFRLILDERILNIDNKIKSLQIQNKQDALFGEEEFNEKIKEEIEELKKEKQNLIEIKNNLNKGTKPFIWDIDFVEIFSDEYEGGFDIVIGNPPYVSYKRIKPSQITKPSLAQIVTYKKRLLDMLRTDWDIMTTDFDRKSDLYVYFYFKGLKLLNSKGTFCYITSNFWLDVDYGKVLQEFLLKNVKIHAIYDNSAKRSFKNADINTIISLFSSSDIKKRDENLQHLAKFVMFKKPFEEVINITNLLKIENTDSVLTTDDYKVYPKKQIELLEEGWEYPEDLLEEQQKVFGFNIGKYTGNKWGGKYLRAPDIYYKILNENYKKLIKLGSPELAEIKTGLKESGYNKYMRHKDNVPQNNKEKYIPILRKPDFFRSIVIKDYDYCITSKIRFFENKIQNKIAKILWLAMRGERHICYLNEKMFPFTGNFFGIVPKKTEHILPLLAILNSSFTYFLVEIFGRKGFGGGALILVKSDLEKFEILNPITLNVNILNALTTTVESMLKREIKSIFQECGFNSDLPIHEQEPNPLPDRKELDDIIFDVLGLTEQERKEVYWSVCELVKNRLEKARSV